MNERFSLDWNRPFMEGASTHVTLFDGGKHPLQVVASGHGTHDADALADLLAVLKERRESAEAIAYVTEKYAALTGTSTRSRS